MVTLARFGIIGAVNALSNFSMTQNEGHLEALATARTMDDEPDDLATLLEKNNDLPLNCPIANSVLKNKSTRNKGTKAI